MICDHPEKNKHVLAKTVRVDKSNIKMHVPSLQRIATTSRLTGVIVQGLFEIHQCPRKLVLPRNLKEGIYERKLTCFPKFDLRTLKIYII